MNIVIHALLLIVAYFIASFSGLLVGINLVFRSIRRSGYFSLGGYCIVGRTEQLRPRLGNEPPADAVFSCVCGGSGPMRQWDDPAVVALMNSCDHTDACEWMKRNVAKTLRSMPK